MRRFIALRKEHPVFGLGTYEPLTPSNPRIFAHIRRYEDDVMLCVHNLARSAQAVELDLSQFEGRYPVEIFGRSRFPRIGELPYLLTLAPRGFFWFQLAGAARRSPTMADVADRVAAGDLSFLEEAPLHDWVVEQRWFASKSREVASLERARGACRCATRRRCSCSRWSRRASRPARTSSTSCRSACGRPTRAGASA